MSGRWDHPEEWSNEDTEALSAALSQIMGSYKTQAEVIVKSLSASMTFKAPDLTGLGLVLQKLSDSIAQIYGPQFQAMFESLGKVVARIFPENWDAVTKPKLGDLRVILLDEGIPLMWVPGARILEALTNAPDAATRRRIVGQRWKGILSDCEVALTTIDHPDLVEERYFGAKCVAALRDGHGEAAQALAANLLDSVLRGLLSKESREKLTRNNYRKTGTKLDLDEYEIRVAFTFAPVWHAHAQYWVEDGDPVPRKFGRHPSAHAVSRVQYTRINAVIALMLVTSVLKFFDTELPR